MPRWTGARAQAVHMAVVGETCPVEWRDPIPMGPSRRSIAQLVLRAIIPRSGLLKKRKK
jgi:hypothetical protein